MWTLSLLLLCTCGYVVSETNNDNGNEDPILYYYGLEESERSLPVCAARQACSAMVQRYWRAPALLRLCRCARRRGCDTPAPPLSRLDFNNRASFQFCNPVTAWPQCDYSAASLTVETKYDRLNPEELEEQHHKNIQLVPPKIVFSCQCQEHNYWKLNSSTEYDDIQVFHCSSLPPCNSGQYCGNVSGDLYALYQSCLCPKHHICVHNGGIPHLDITELLYRGKGWRAYCQPIGDYNYEDYE